MDQSNLDEMIKTIKRLVMLNKDQVPKGSLLWNKKPIKDVDDLMNFLVACHHASIFLSCFVYLDTLSISLV